MLLPSAFSWSEPRSSELNEMGLLTFKASFMKRERERRWNMKLWKCQGNDMIKVFGSTRDINNAGSKITTISRSHHRRLAAISCRGATDPEANPGHRALPFHRSGSRLPAPDNHQLRLASSLFDPT